MLHITNHEKNSGFERKSLAWDKVKRQNTGLECANCLCEMKLQSKKMSWDRFNGEGEGENVKWPTDFATTFFKKK